MRSLLLLILAIFQLSVHAQKEDYIWPIGYRAQTDTPVVGFGCMNVDFNDLDAKVSTVPERDMYMGSNSSSICNGESGELLLYTDGFQVHNKHNKLLMNGDSLMNESGGVFGDGRTQSSMILPWPDRDSLYILIYRHWEVVQRESNPDQWGRASVRPFYAVIDLKEGDGLGAVVSRENVLIQDTLTDGRFTACRHANGRDWWIYMGKWSSRKMYVFLLDHKGIRLSHTEDLGLDLPYQYGRAEFTPDGSRYILRTGDFDVDSNSVAIYGFNRCTGKFTGLIEQFYLDIELQTAEAGIAISPSSRFLYVTLDEFFLQYDLHAKSIKDSGITIAEWDGFQDPFGTLFLYPVHSPIGKIYIQPTHTASVWHTVHAPDSLGTACRVRQHDFDLPNYNFGTTHNFPHFRLGPIDGSQCDTLGIDNMPVALFRHEEKKLHTWFTDLSYYNPQDWHWTFGDGDMSSERFPVHDYEEQGKYEVCLTVSNNFGTHTWCDSIEVDSLIVSTTNEEITVTRIYPNPTDDIVYIDNSEGQFETFELYDLTGRVLTQGILGDNIQEIDLSILCGQCDVVIMALIDHKGRRVTRKLLHR